MIVLFLEMFELSLETGEFCVRCSNKFLEFVDAVLSPSLPPVI